MIDVGSRRFPAAVHSNGDLVAPRGAYGGGITSRPAKVGDIVALYTSGMGPSQPVVSIRERIQEPRALADASSLAVHIGGKACEVRFAGLVGSGLYQVNVVIPDTPAGDQPLTLEIAGIAAPTVQLTVER
jgi:uncharacterized protein (TIGR03437 family)